MPHTLNPSVPITLDKERSLLYGAAAFIEFKEATGRDLMRAIVDLVENFTKAKEDPAYEVPFKEFRDILWAGLIHEDDDLTQKQTGNLFTFVKMLEIFSSVIDAFNFAMGHDHKDGNARPLKAPAKHRRSTGAVSGQLRVATSG